VPLQISSPERQSYDYSVGKLRFPYWHDYSLWEAMKQIIGIALLVVGIVLLCMAYDSYHSAASGVSRVVTGTSTDKTVWLTVGGVVGSVLGLGGLLMRGSKI